MGFVFGFFFFLHAVLNCVGTLFAFVFTVFELNLVYFSVTVVSKQNGPYQIS